MAKVPDWVDAQKDFQSWWTGKDNWCYPFHDTREAMGVSGSRRVYTDERPSDFLVVSRGSMFFAEVKSSSHETSFSLSNIRVGQWRAAIRTAAAGGVYRFYIRREPEKVWYQVPGEFFISLFKAEVKSVKWKDIELYRKPT